MLDGHLIDRLLARGLRSGPPEPGCPGPGRPTTDRRAERDSWYDAVVGEGPEIIRFSVSGQWPDADDLEHLRRWRALAWQDGGHSPWRARAVIVADATEAGTNVDAGTQAGPAGDAGPTLVGHAGFHGPPQAIAVALDDPTFVGRVDPCPGGAVEIGYTILAPFRGRGYACEAVIGLIDWARATGEVAAVIACVRPDNGPSLAVLERVGGFDPIGRCRDGDDDEVVFRRDMP